MSRSSSRESRESTGGPEAIFVDISPYERTEKLKARLRKAESLHLYMLSVSALGTIAALVPSLFTYTLWVGSFGLYIIRRVLP